MSHKQHTADKWEPIHEHGEIWWIRQPNGKALEATEHNVRLASAAPILLYACERALYALSNMTTDDFALGYDKPTRDALTNAIALATARKISESRAQREGGAR